MRSWTLTSRLCSDKQGKYMQSVRQFGVEIECQYSRSVEANNVIYHMDTAIGYGYDGSISGAGLEFRTPPSSGDTGENMVLDLCERLQNNNFKVDWSCGLHVHIDAGDLAKMLANGKEKEVSSIVKRYWLFHLAMEGVIRSFLPCKRRYNSYCKALEPVWEAVSKAKTYDTLKNIYWSNSPQYLDERHKGRNYKDTGRYHGVNLLSLFEHFHPEIRYHNGTIKGDRILHWANLHCLIMDKCVDGTLTMEFINDMKKTASIVKRTEAMFEILGLNERARDYFRSRQVRFYNKLAKNLSSQVMDLTQELLANPY